MVVLSGEAAATSEFGEDAPELDPYRSDERVNLGRKTKDWLWPARPKNDNSDPADAVYPGVTVSVVLKQANGERHLWAGEVIDRFHDSFQLQLWGVVQPVTYRVRTVERSGAVQPHTSAEYRDVARRQRSGQPAKVYPPQK